MVVMVVIKKMTGASAPDLVVKVPEGTTIYDSSTDQPLADLTQPGETKVIVKGGRGGRGNVHFATAKNSAPEIAENGEPGEELTVKLQLRLLADVGLVGFPSAGKSTLLSAVTSAKPKIGSYHFTTLVPNLGIVRTDDGADFVIADLPGLIAGASQGVGLGFEFLHHIQRTRVILHLVDMSGTEGRDPYADFQQINQELSDFDSSLLQRPQIVVPTKMDLPDATTHLTEFKQKLATDSQYRDVKVDPISAVTHAGVRQLLRDTAEILKTAPTFAMEPETSEPETQFTADTEPSFVINHDEDGNWILSGRKIERLVQMTNTEHTQSTLRFARQLRSMGVDEALRKAGAQDGDQVKILDFMFTYTN